MPAKKKGAGQPKKGAVGKKAEKGISSEQVREIAGSIVKDIITESVMTPGEKIKKLHPSARTSVQKHVVDYRNSMTQEMAEETAYNDYIQRRDQKEADKRNAAANKAQRAIASGKVATAKHDMAKEMKAKSNFEIAKDLEAFKKAEGKIMNAREQLKQAEKKIIEERQHQLQLRESIRTATTEDLLHLDARMQALQGELVQRIIHVADAEIQADNLVTATGEMRDTAEVERLIQELAGLTFEGELLENAINAQELAGFGAEAASLEMELDPDLIPAIAGAVLAVGQLAGGVSAGGAGPAPPIAATVGQIAAAVGQHPEQIAGAAGQAAQVVGRAKIMGMGEYVAQGMGTQVVPGSALVTPTHPIWSNAIRDYAKRSNYPAGGELTFRQRTIQSLLKVVEDTFEHPVTRSTESFYRRHPKGTITGLAVAGAGIKYLLSSEKDTSALKSSVKNAASMGVGYVTGYPGLVDAVIASAGKLPAVKDYLADALNFAGKFEEYHPGEDEYQKAAEEEEMKRNKGTQTEGPGYAGTDSTATHTQGTQTVMTGRDDFTKNPNTIIYKPAPKYEDPPAVFQPGRTYGPKIPSPIGGPDHTVPAARPPTHARLEDPKQMIKSLDKLPSQPRFTHVRQEDPEQMGKPLDDKYFDQMTEYRKEQQRLYAHRGGYGPYFPTTLTSAQSQQIKKASRTGKIHTLSDLDKGVSPLGPERDTRAWNIGIHRGEKHIIDAHAKLAQLRAQALSAVKKALEDAKSMSEAARLKAKYDNLTPQVLSQDAIAHLLGAITNKDRKAARTAAEMFVAMNYEKYKKVIDKEIMGDIVVYPQFTRPVINKSQYF